MTPERADELSSSFSLLDMATVAANDTVKILSSNKSSVEAGLTNLEDARNKREKRRERNLKNGKTSTE